MENNKVLKTYTLPNSIKQERLDPNATACKYTLSVAYEQIATEFAKQDDEALMNFLYEKYKDTDIARVYVLSRPEFEDFLLKMLPKYLNRET